jgi:hypothetical protein
MKAALFFFAGLVILLSVVGGVEQSVDIGILEALQAIAMTLVGFGLMAMGVSYANEKEEDHV